MDRWSSADDTPSPSSTTKANSRAGEDGGGWGRVWGSTRANIAHVRPRPEGLAERGAGT
jgi:hypothetical protein